MELPQPWLEADGGRGRLRILRLRDAESSEILAQMDPWQSDDLKLMAFSRQQWQANEKRTILSFYVCDTFTPKSSAVLQQLDHGNHLTNN